MGMGKRRRRKLPSAHNSMHIAYYYYTAARGRKGRYNMPTHWDSHRQSATSNWCSEALCSPSSALFHSPLTFCFVATKDVFRSLSGVAVTVSRFCPIGLLLRTMPLQKNTTRAERRYVGGARGVRKTRGYWRRNREIPARTCRRRLDSFQCGNLSTPTMGI